MCNKIMFFLQNSVENETNYIFSPFGYSMILGVLSEGARGDTQEELQKILHSPQDVNLIRETFRNTLQRLQVSTTCYHKIYVIVYYATST